MRLFRFLGKSSQDRRVGGAIAYHGLTDWWLTSFTPEEREYITDRYKPFGDPRPRPLTEGLVREVRHADGSPSDATDLLTSLAGWFNNPRDRHLAKQMLLHAEALSAGSRVLTRHFLYSQMIEVFYRDRDTDPRALSIAIRACEQQIALAPQAIKAFRRDYERLNKRLADFDRRAGRKPDPPPPFQLPSHRGYKQLCIIREKEGNLTEALRLARQALRQGWSGDWERRIERYQRKLSKQGQCGR